MDQHIHIHMSPRQSGKSWTVRDSGSLRAWFMDAFSDGDHPRDASGKFKSEGAANAAGLAAGKHLKSKGYTHGVTLHHDAGGTTRHYKHSSGHSATVSVQPHPEGGWHVQLKTQQPSR